MVINMTNSYLKKIISVAACAVLTAVFIVVMFFCSPSVGAVPETEGTIARSFFNSETGTVEKETKIIGKDITATRITDLGLPKKITKVNYVADKFVKLNPFDSDFQIVDLTKPFEFAEKGTLMFVIMNLDSLAEDFDDQAEKLAVYKSGDYWRFTVSLPKIFSASVVYNGANLVAEHGKIQNYNFADFNTSYVKQTDSFSEQTENTLVDIDFYTRRGMQNDVNITIHYQSSGGVYSGLAECPLIGTKDAVKSINDNSQNLLLAITILAVVVLGVLIVLSLLKHTKELIPAAVWIFGITLLLLTRFILRQATTSPLFWTGAWLISSFVILGGALLSMGRNFGKVPTKYIFPALMGLGALFAFICPFVPFGAAIGLNIVCKVVKAVGAVVLLGFIGLAVACKNDKNSTLNIICAAIICVAIGAALFMPQIFPVQINPIFWLCAVTVVATFIRVFMLFRETEKANDYLTKNLHLEVARQVKDIRAVIDEREKLLQFVSHDMKKPLSSAVMLCNTAIEREKDDEQIKTISIIKQDAERVIEHLSEIAAYSKLNYIAEPSQVVDMSELCALLYKFHKFDCDANGIILYNTVDAHVKAFVKPKGLENVMSNIIINAIEHANCKTITLSVKTDKNKVVLCVADDGKGIDESLDVFKAYVSENDSETGGVGLYICKNIIESMNGELSYETGQNGTTFYISLLKA